MLLVFGIRPKASESRTVYLVGTNYNKIVSEASTLLDDEAAYQRCRKPLTHMAMDWLAEG